MLRLRNPLSALLGIGILVAATATVPTTLAQRRQVRPPRVKKSEQPAAKRIHLLAGFSDWVTSLACSPDGKTIAAGSYQTVKLWDAESKKLRTSLKIESGYAKSLAFSPDSQTLVVGSYQSVSLWNSADGKLQTTLKGHRGYVTGAAFSPDGKLLATSSEDESVRLWNLTDYSPGHVLRGHLYPVQGVAFSPDGKLLATAAGDENRVTRPGEVKLWDVATGKETATLPEHKKAATNVAFSPDGKFLASTSFDETVNIYEVATAKAIGFFGGHGRPTNSVVFTSDGKTVISGCGGRAKGGNEVKLWDRQTGEEWATIEAHKAKITAVCLTPDGKTLATASYDKTVALWDVGPILGRHSQPAEPVVAQKPAQDQLAKANDVAEATQSEGKERDEPKPKSLRVGIIGLDTSHAIAFSKILTDKNAMPDVANCRVVAAYPKGSPDIESSVSRVPGYTKQIREMGIEIVDSIPSLLEKVDVVLLETNDGRPHLEQILPVLKAGKPVFIDKPIAGSLTDAVAIFQAARRYKVPIFSSSSLRYSPGAQALRNGKVGAIKSCETHSPCSLEKTHPDLFWYGIHGVESLFTVMGTGCQSVKRTVNTADMDEVVGQWKGGRTGTFRGYRKGGPGGYGGSAVGENGTSEIGKFGGYRPLLVEIVKFFRTNKPPVSEQETIEIYAFMEAADESKRQGGAEVTLESVLTKARKAAKKRLAELD